MGAPPAQRRLSGLVPPVGVSLDSEGFAQADDSQSSVDRGISKEGPSALAVDLCSGRYDALKGRPMRTLGFGNLRVLLLSGSSLTMGSLAGILEQCALLQKLDASRCGLAALPDAALWGALKHLAILFLHSNQLKRWEDMVALSAPPSLLWVTAFGNPITFSAQYRQFILESRHTLLAIDLAMVTDAERIDPSRGATDPNGSTHRFAASPLPMACAHHVERDGDGSKPEMGPEVLLTDLDRDLKTLSWQALRCSAVRHVQKIWRGFHTRSKFDSAKTVLRSSVLLIQKHVRAFLWRKGVYRYVKRFLREIGGENLILDDQALFRLRAQRLMDAALVGWVRKRRRQEKVRRACELLARKTRGFLARRRHFYALNELTPDSDGNSPEGDNLCIYFPERVAWGFLTLLNVTNKALGLEPLPEDHEFAVSDVLGVRVPEPDEVSQLSPTATLEMFNFRKHCVLRPQRSGRYPQHPWDGPAHRLPGDSHFRHRVSHFDRATHEAFRASCCSGEHPVTAGDGGRPSPPCEDLRLRQALQQPSSEWPQEWHALGSAIGAFMTEAAKAKGMVWPKRRRTHGVIMDPETGRRAYAGACWGTQRLLVYRCPSARVAAHLWPLIVAFNRSAASVTFLRPVPFIPGIFARQICAAVVIQCSYRAHRARANLGVELARRLAACQNSQLHKSGGVLWAALEARSPAPVGLVNVVAAQRAAICVQRCWRWSLLKRRFALLCGALDYVQAVRGSCVYVEERLFMSMNLINAVHRYPPGISEAALQFGYAMPGEAGPGAIVLVDEELRGRSRKRRIFGASSAARSSPEEWEKVVRKGLPTWLLQRLGADCPAVGPDDDRLPQQCSAQALVRLGLLDPERRPEELVREVFIASLQHLARQQKSASTRTVDPQGRSVPSAALRASGGSFRLVELRFPSLAMARLHALALYFCTYRPALGGRGGVVPLLQEGRLQDIAAFRQVLELWDVYGLSWTDGDRVAPQRARQWDAVGNTSAAGVAVDGTLELRSLEKPDQWAAASGEGGADVHGGAKDNKDATSSARQQRAVQEAVFQRFHKFVDHVADRRQDMQRRLEDRLAAIEDPTANGGTITGGSEVKITGSLPPMTAARAGDAQAAANAERLERNAVRTAFAERLAEDLEEKQEQCAAVAEWRTQGRAGREFEDRIYAFHEACDEERRRNEALERRRCAEETQMMKIIEQRMEKPLPRPAAEDAHRASLLRNTAAQLDLERRAEAHAVAEMQRLEETRERARQQKARQNARKEATEALRGLTSKRSLLERGIQQDDAATMREAIEASNLVKVLALNDHWDDVSRNLQYRATHGRRHRLKEVNDYKEHLHALAAAASSAREAELMEVRSRVADQKALDRLVRAARSQLDTCELLAPQGQADADYEAAVAKAVELAGRAAGALHGALQPIRRSISDGGGISSGEAAPPLPLPPPPPPASKPGLHQKPPELLPRRLQAYSASPRVATGRAASTAPASARGPPSGGDGSSKPRSGGSSLPPLSARGGGGPPADVVAPWLRKLGAAHLAAR